MNIKFYETNYDTFNTKLGKIKKQVPVLENLILIQHKRLDLFKKEKERSLNSIKKTKIKKKELIEKKYNQYESAIEVIKILK